MHTDIYMKKTIAAIALFSLPFHAFADAQTVTSPAEIEKIITRIPVADKTFGYKNIGERMRKIGMKISSVRIDKIGKEDAEPPMYRIGDQVISIFTSEPSEVVKAICPILGSPVFIKRGGLYVPSGRTAYWLMNNKCETGEQG